MRDKKSFTPLCPAAVLHGGTKSGETDRLDQDCLTGFLRFFGGVDSGRARISPDFRAPALCIRSQPDKSERTRARGAGAWPRREGHPEALTGFARFFRAEPEGASDFAISLPLIEAPTV